MPNCFVIAGPNGAGKTTFALEFLPLEAESIDFVNADMIAAGIAPFSPEAAAVEAGRIFLGKIDTLAAAGKDFAFETTLSGRGHLRRLEKWRQQGYHITLIYLMLPDEEMAVARVAARVAAGGHHIPEATIRRRFDRSLSNFDLYLDVADEWFRYDNSTFAPLLLAHGGNDEI